MSYGQRPWFATCFVDDNWDPEIQIFCFRSLSQVHCFYWRGVWVGTIFWFVGLLCCCMDVDDFVSHAFSFDNWTMLKWSRVLRVVSLVTMLKSNFFLDVGYRLWVNFEWCNWWGQTLFLVWRHKLCISSRLVGYKCPTTYCPTHAYSLQCIHNNEPRLEIINGLHT
jgi:hypothetical protein